MAKVKLFLQRKFCDVFVVEKPMRTLPVNHYHLPTPFLPPWYNLDSLSATFDAKPIKPPIREFLSKNK